jgi:hypothetical protein
MLLELAATRDVLKYNKDTRIIITTYEAVALMI